MTTATGAPKYCENERAILATLRYFEIFSHPLTAGETFRFSQISSTWQASFSSCLAALVERGDIYSIGGFFLSQNEPAWVARRLEQNRRADAALPVAQRMARLIGAFPFVRGVFVSGSLSKHCMAENSDVDFFLITEPGRLWLARTLLVAFKKTFLLNSHKYFCINYFVDTEHLEIEEKNLFTATETATLLPLYGREWHDQFYAANADWVRRFLPNFPKRDNANVPTHSLSFLKKTAEWLLAGRLGDWLDRAAMRLTVRFWRQKFRHFDDATFDSAIKSRRYVSKHHPLYFQKKVLEQYAEKTSHLGWPGSASH